MFIIMTVSGSNDWQGDAGGEKSIVLISVIKVIVV